MLEILWKGLFFLSMLVLYANVTSIVLTVVLVIGFAVCVSSYYYFNKIQGAIDELLQYINFSSKFPDNMNPSQVSGYFMNKKYNKISNTGITSMSGKKIFSGLCNTENAFPKESSLLDSCGPSMMKRYNNGELPSPIMKNNSPVRSKVCRDKLKITFSPKDIASRKNAQTYNPLNPSRRYNANWDLETFMNVNSPGFTSRVVDKAAESASYHIKYPAVRQVSSYRFDKSTLRQLSKMPRAGSTPAIRIAPPESSSVDMLAHENTVNENGNENSRNNNILQVLKDMSRKRNYTQEEADRSGSTPKKSRKHEIRNVVSSQYKRAHEDCSSDSIEDKSRKKRCEESAVDCYDEFDPRLPESSFVEEDGDYVRVVGGKILNRTNCTYRRKLNSSKIDPVPVISTEREYVPTPMNDEDNLKGSLRAHEDCSSDSIEDRSPKKRCLESAVSCYDEFDSRLPESSFVEEDGDYVRVVGGKILNRTNCTYRRKLNSSKIDPVSVISTEREYVTTAMNDEDNMKESLLNNLINDIERQGKKSDSVIFYQNSIVEEVSKNIVVEVDVHRPDTAVHTSSSLNPLLPLTTKPPLQFGVSAAVVSESNSEPTLTATSSPAPTFSTSNTTNPLLGGQKSGGFAFPATPTNEVDTPKLSTTSKPLEPVARITPLSTSPVSIASSLLPTSIPLNVTGASSTSTTNVAQVAVTSSTPTVTATPVASSNSTVEKQSQSSFSAPLDKPAYSFGTSTTNLMFSASSNGTTSESSNPLLNKSSSITTNPPTIYQKPISFGNSQPVTASPNTTPKVMMFGNTTNTSPSSGTPATQSNSFSSNIFSTSTKTTPVISAAASVASPFSTSTQPSAMPAPSFQFGQSSTPATTTSTNISNTFTFAQTASAGGFKFGEAAQPATATASPATSGLNVGSAATFSSPSTFGPPVTAASLGSSFNVPTTTSSFSYSALSFGNSAAGSSTTPSFTFGSQTSNTFASAGAVAQPSIFDNSNQTSSTQPSVFGNVQNTNAAAPQSSVFGGNAGTQVLTFGNSSSQLTAGASVFGSSNVANNQPSVFGASSQAPAQTNLFSQTPQISQPSFVSTPQTLGAGDAANVNVFGQNQSTAPPVGVVNPLPQTGQFGGGERFTFGVSSQQQAPPAFGSVQATFGNASTGQPAFNSVTPSFNFSAGSTGFGANAGGSTFGAATATPLNSGAGQVFGFGTNAASATPAQQPTAFQFGGPQAAVPAAQPNQPFMFGGGAPVAAPAGAGFSIGSGGSNSRNRAMARPRKAK